MANRWGNNGNRERFYFGGAPKSLQMVTAPMKLKDTCSLEEKLWPREDITKQRHCFANKGLCSQSYGFSSSHIWMCELDYKESWAPKNWCFWTVVLEKTLESSWGCKEIQPVNYKGNQSWMFIGRTDAETPILWPPDAGKDWRLKEKGTTEDEMVRWHHRLNAHVLQSMGSQRIGHDSASGLPRWFIGKESCRAGDRGSILGRENPLEEEMATHLPEKSPGQRNLCLWGLKESDRTAWLSNKLVFIFSTLPQ